MEDKALADEQREMIQLDLMLKEASDIIKQRRNKENKNEVRTNRPEEQRTN